MSFKDRLKTNVSNIVRGTPDSQPNLERSTLGLRKSIHDEFEQNARFGSVPAAALIEKLYANHLDEVAEDQRRLDGLEQQLESHLRRWDSAFPAPVPPAPEPPTPPPVRQFRRMRDIWGKGASTRH